MQLRKNYESTNVKIRASECRTAARECERAGYQGLAQVNWEMAEWLDPTPRETPPKSPRRIAAVAPSDEGGADIIPMTKRAQRAANRPVRALPVGTTIVGRGNSGRILKQNIRDTDRRAA